ncbi:MAG: HAD family phosphatase [Bacteroidales bacterium]|jgi:putative hydrolase of the HAD superfamily|nr:HAD family phosphatase [Bacteroidales bacterium]
MLENITSIIFDFGGVILNLNEQRTYSALMQLLQCNAHDLSRSVAQNNVFRNYECGLISSDEFVAYIQSLAPHYISAQQITDAWNAMLLDFPPAHVELLLRLKMQYRTFLLSNTNDLHEKAFVQNMKNQGIKHSIHDLFETVWYSHHLHLNKPHVEIFETVIAQAGLNPEHTLFLDDKEENLVGARKAGLRTQLIDKETSILKIFKNH